MKKLKIVGDVGYITYIRAVIYYGTEHDEIQ